MMRTINLSGFTTGDSLSVSVSQGALTAGPYDVPAWGQPNTGGTITIIAERGHMEVAPESIRFSVDLSASTFDTAGPGAGEVYDARLHDLIYLWDMGDSVTTWGKPVNVLAGWKNRNAAMGPFVMHMYPAPGTFSPSVLVIEPSTGKTATATLSGVDAIEVLDPDDVYSGASTICISTSGDFTGAPDGAVQITASGLDYQATPWTTYLGGTAKRWLFKRGETFTSRLNIGSTTTRGVYFGAYGTGARPVIEWDGTTSGDLTQRLPFYIGTYGLEDPSAPADIRFSGLAFVGDFDPTTMRADYDMFNASPLAIWCLADVNGMVSDCHIEGQRGTSINFRGSTLTKEVSWHLDDCSLTAFGGQYPLYGGTSTHAKSGIGITGCLLAQSAGAMGVDTRAEGSSRAIVRCGNPHRYHMRCVDSYHTDYNQHHFVPFKDPKEQGGLVNVHSCSAEGGTGMMDFYANPYGAGNIDVGNSIAMNVIVDGCMYLCTHSSKSPFFTHASGITIRNSIVIQPGLNRTALSHVGFLFVDVLGTFDETMVGNAPVRVYSSTYIYLKTDAQGTAFGVTQDPPVIKYQAASDDFNVVIDQNNILHKPNAGPTATQVTTFAPLTETVLFTPRDQGYWTSDPCFASCLMAGYSSTVAHNATLTFSYADAYGYADLPTTQTSFAGSNGKEQVVIYNGGIHETIYTAANGDIEVTYDTSEIRVKNTSGVTWAPAGKTLWVQLDMGTTAPVATNSTVPIDAWKDYQPGTESAALLAATTGNRGWFDLTGDARLTGYNAGTIDAGAWQVS